jgi:TolA-binding protein
MDTVTYPDKEVVQYLSEHFVCFKPRIDAQRSLAQQLGVVWTPGLVWLDAAGDVCHQNVGYFAPEELLAECAFGRGKSAALKGEWAEAKGCFTEVTESWPSSFAAPAALYWSGAASMMATKDKEAMLKSWNRLLEDHPDSAWAMKVSFLRNQS